MWPTRKSHKMVWILVCFVQINHFSKFQFLGKSLIWLNRIGIGLLPKSFLTLGRYNAIIAQHQLLSIINAVW